MILSQRQPVTIMEFDSRNIWEGQVPHETQSWQESDGGAAVLRGMALDIALGEGHAGSKWATALNQHVNILAHAISGGKFDGVWRKTRIRVGPLPLSCAPADSQDKNGKDIVLGMGDFERYILSCSLDEIKDLIVLYEGHFGPGEQTARLAAKHLFVDACVSLAKIPLIQISGVRDQSSPSKWWHVRIEKY